MPLSASELQYLRPTTLTTWSHSQWCDAVLNTPGRYDGWYITKVEHMKDFHNSDVFHEFLRLTISGGTPHTETYLFVERMTNGDEVTAGWTWAKPSPSRGVSFSRPDLLYTITVPRPGIPITELAEPLRRAHKDLGSYVFIGRNCYTFARMVYDDLLDAARGLYPAQRDTIERAEQYHEHRAIFAGLVLGVSITPLFWVRAVADEQSSRIIQRPRRRKLRTMRCGSIFVERLGIDEDGN